MESLEDIDGVLPANQARSRNARDRLLQAGERVGVLVNLVAGDLAGDDLGEDIVWIVGRHVVSYSAGWSAPVSGFCQKRKRK